MDPASPSKPEKQKRGGLVFALGLLVGIAIASVSIWWSWNGTLSPDSRPVINIGDGSGMMGREILAAAALLSNERVVRIEFSHQARPRSIFAGGRLPNNGVEIDIMMIQITPWKIEINDEEVSLSVLRERLQVYARSAELTGSRPILLLVCSDGVEASKLVEVFSVLVDNGIDSLRLADHRWIFEPRPTPPPSPQIKPLAHPVELK
jgi:hypothetical protein